MALELKVLSSIPSFIFLFILQRTFQQTTLFVWCFLVNVGSPPCIQKGKPQSQIWFLLFFFFHFPLKTKKNNQEKKNSRKKFLFIFFFSRTFFLFFFSGDFFFSDQPTLFFVFFFQEQSVLSLLNLLQGLQRESKDCEKDHYKNKTRKPNNTKMSSLVSVTISLKQIRRLPGARKSHFDVCFP